MDLIVELKKINVHLTSVLILERFSLVFQNISKFGKVILTIDVTNETYCPTDTLYDWKMI